MTNAINGSNQTPHTNRERPKCSLFKVMMSVAAIVASVWMRTSPHLNQRAPIRIEACRQNNCPPLPDLRPYEKLVDPNLLQLSHEKNLPVALWLAGTSDHNGAFNPQIQNLSVLTNDGRYQLKYSQVEDYEEICSEIKAAAEVGPVAAVLLQGHAFPRKMTLSEKSDISFGAPHHKCFSAMEPTSPIILFGCNGGEGKYSIGEVLATESQRVVIAADTSVMSSGLKFHPGLPPRVEFYNSDSEDVTRTFKPMDRTYTREEFSDIINYHLGDLAFIEKAFELVEKNATDELEKILQTNQLSHGIFERAILHAVENGKNDVLKVLLNCGKKVLKKTRVKAFEIAAEKNRIEATKQLLANGFISDNDKFNAISRASLNGHFELIELIFRSGPISEEKIGNALILASRNGEIALVHAILVNSKVSNQYSTAAFSWALTSGQAETSKALLKIVPHSEALPLVITQAVNGKIELVNQILAMREITQTDRGIALMCAARSRQLEIMKALFEDGPISENHLGISLVNSVNIGHVESINFLLANANFSEIDRSWALQSACKLGHNQIVNLILASGPISVATIGREMVHAIENGNFQIAKTLYSQTQTPSDALLHATSEAASEGKPSVIKSLLSIGKLTRSELDRVIQAANGNREIIELLNNSFIA